MQNDTTRESSPGAGRSLGADQPAQSPAATPMSPGDEAPEGTPGTAPNVCRGCGGSGRLDGGVCPQCQGTGQVNVGIGGA